MDHMGKSVDEMSLKEVRALVDTLEARNEELTGLVTDEMLQEAGEFSTAQLALEDIGWRPLAGIADSSNSFTLEGLHRASELCRAVATVNPLVERGLKVRTGYIWGSGVSVVAKEFISGGPGRPRSVNIEPSLPPGIEDVLTGSLAQMEIEMTAATDGNLFFLVDKKNKTVQRVPFEEVTEAVSQRGNRERILYIRRTWNDWDLELDSGEGVDTHPVTNPDFSRGSRTWTNMNRDGSASASYRNISVWYPTHLLMEQPDNRRRARTHIDRDPVDHDKVIVHVPFNRMVGWRWGVPDVLPAVWWTKAYKEYLENCATLTKAYARFAWKVTSERSRGVRRTAAQLAQAPRTDPTTGQPLSVGASAVLGAGQDLSAVGGNTKVDFDAGRPLAAMIAAALDVPLPALTEDPTLGTRATAAVLDTSTVLVMQMRQKVMDEAFTTIFRLLGLKVRLRWPEISEEPIHRRLQAINMAVRLGLFTADEARAMVLDAWHDKWDDFPRQAPPPSKVPFILQPMQGQQPTSSATSPQPSANGPAQVDPPSMGDHELRDEGPSASSDTGD
jgi:hypothetical protein